MKTYTETDLRLAFQAGERYQADLEERGVYTSESNENEYIDSLKETVDAEEEITFSYSFLRRKLNWEEFCELTGIDLYARQNGYDPQDTTTFTVKESQAIKFGLL